MRSYLFVRTLVRILYFLVYNFFFWLVQIGSYVHCFLIKRCLPVFAAAIQCFLFWLHVWLACICLKVTQNASTFRTCCLLGALRVHATELMLLWCPVMTGLTGSWRFDTFRMREGSTRCLPCVMLWEIAVKTSIVWCATREWHLNVCMAREMEIEFEIEMVYLFMRCKKTRCVVNLQYN